MSGWWSLSNLRWYCAHFLQPISLVHLLCALSSLKQQGFLSSLKKGFISLLCRLSCVSSISPSVSTQLVHESLFSMNSCSLLFFEVVQIGGQMILCILSFLFIRSVLSEAGAQSLLHLSSTHCYLSTLLSLPLSLSFFLSPSLFQKEEAQRVTMEKNGTNKSQWI